MNRAELTHGGYAKKGIRYKLEAQSKGRNGFFSTTGIVLEGWKRLEEDIIEISTITGKGFPSKSILLRVPKSIAAEMGQALIDLSKENRA